MMPLSPPTAPKTVIMTPAMIHAQEAQKCQFVILGFLTSSQKIEGREYVVGPNPKAPMNPSRSAAKSYYSVQVLHQLVQQYTQNMQQEELYTHEQSLLATGRCSTFADRTTQACVMPCIPALLHTIPVHSLSCCTQHKDAAYNTMMHQ